MDPSQIIDRPAVCMRLINGLGDRMLDFIGFYIICKYLGYKPHVKIQNGIQYSWGNITYDLRLFQDFADVTILPDDAQCPFYINPPNPSSSLCPYRTFLFLQTFLPTITFEQISRDFEIYAKQLIRPSDIILQNIPEGIENAYGIHLRKSDKVKDCVQIRFENSYHDFEIIMDHLLQDVARIIVTESSPSFLLVSEDTQWKYEIQRRIESIANIYQKKVRFLVPNMDENCNSYSNYHSVMDMFCLSRCKDILQGVNYSAFSILAALLGNKKLRNYSPYTDNGHLCLIYSWNSVLEINSKMNYDLQMHEKITEEVAYVETNITTINICDK